MGEEFEVIDRMTGQKQHVSLAHLHDRDPERTLVAWRWSYRPKAGLTGAQADRLLEFQRELHPDLEPKPGVREHLTGGD